MNVWLPCPCHVVAPAILNCAPVFAPRLLRCACGLIMQYWYQYCAADMLQASISCCSNAVKNIGFHSFCMSMYAWQLWCNFRKAYIHRLHVDFNFGWMALYNLPLRASVSSHQVQYNIPTFEALLRKNVYLFLAWCESLTMYGCTLWCSQIVYIHPCSLNTTTTFYFATECSDVTVFIRLRVCACHNTSVLYLTLTRVVLSVLLWM